MKLLGWVGVHVHIHHVTWECLKEKIYSVRRKYFCKTLSTFSVWRFRDHFVKVWASPAADDGRQTLQNSRTEAKIWIFARKSQKSFFVCESKWAIIRPKLLMFYLVPLYYIRAHGTINLWFVLHSAQWWGHFQPFPINSVFDFQPPLPQCIAVQCPGFSYVAFCIKSVTYFITASSVYKVTMI